MSGSTTSQTTKRINPAVLPSLKEALTLSFWFRSDLRAFLMTVLPDSASLISQLDWTGYKRNTVSQLVDGLAKNQRKYGEELLQLLLATADIMDPSHLKRVEDGQHKYDEAVAALAALRAQVEPYRKLRGEAEDVLRRQREEEARSALRQAISSKLGELKDVLYQLTVEADHQRRGYALEGLLNQLFALFDIDAKAAFRVIGEQIDGAFSFDSTEYLFEAKWQAGRAAVSDLDSFAGKIGRKLDNTLGLFLSMNGFHDSVMSTYSQNRSPLFLMDGSDLSAVVEDRITLPDLLRRKRQHASRTGEVFLGAYQILGGLGGES